LDQVNVVFNEDPTKALWSLLAENWKELKSRTPGNMEVYARRIQGVNTVKFEQVSIVHRRNSDDFQEVKAFKDYNEYKSDFGRSISFNATYSLNPNVNFSAGQDQAELGQYPFSKFSNSDILPFDRATLDKFAALPIIGIFEPRGWSYYSFTTDSKYSQGGKDFAIISFEPNSNSEGWKGRLKANLSSGRVLFIEAQINGLDIVQHYSDSASFYVKNQNWSWAQGEERFEQVVHRINVFSPAAIKNRSLVAVLPEQQLNDISYWEAFRPESKEIDRWTSKQDSIIRYLNSDEYLDSADAVYNEFHWYEPLVSGIGYRKRSKGINYYLSPLIAQVNVFGVGGTRWTPAGIYSKRFSNYEQLNISLRANYGLKNNDLKGALDLGYTYAPLHNGSIHLKFGNDYQQITQSVDLGGLFLRSNYIEKTFAEAYHRYEWFNGFYTRLGFEYSKRESIEGLDLSSDLFNPLTPIEPFETYTVAQLGAELLIRPFQRYYLKGRQKIVLASKWPDIRITIKQGIPRFLNSDVRYTKYEFNIEDMMRWGAPGETFYVFSSGGFLNDPSTVRFIEHKWFRGGDYFLLTHPIYTFQALPRTFASPEVYFTGNFMHHFNGFFLSRIPVIRNFNMNVACGGAALALPQSDRYHLEAFAGLEKKVQLWDTPSRIGAYYVFLPFDAAPGFRFKLGMDMKNTFLDRWNF
jgi:hypothetical protein